MNRWLLIEVERFPALAEAVLGAAFVAVLLAVGWVALEIAWEVLR